jgi:hypothetical protein
MSEPRAQRTLVKSPPELWAEVSDLEALARHLGEFGEIRITRLEPETTVAWEGDRARGTVQLEPSGWGTKVTLTAELEAAAPQPEPVAAEPEPEPVAAEPEPEPLAAPPTPEPEPAEPEPEPLAAPPTPEPKPVAAEPADGPRAGFFARLFGRRKAEPVGQAEPEAAVLPAPPEPEPDVVAEAASLEPEVVAEAAPPEPEPEPEVVAEAVPPEPETEVVAEAAAPELEPETTAAVEAAHRDPDPDPELVAGPSLSGSLDDDRAQAILAGVLDDLGSAHHRPFSRS